MKYIIFDMDDTLLNNCREVSPYTLEILHALQGRGHKLVCNTARSKSFNQQYFDLIRPDYAILNGGALILDREEKEIFVAELNPETTRAVIRDILAVTDVLSVQTRENFYSHKGQYALQKAVAFDFEAQEFPHPAQKIIASVESAEQAQRIAEKYGIAYTTYLGGTFRRYNHKAATKAQGNENLVKLLGGSLADVIAFGDDHGDIDMLRQAGIGVLMKNANPDLREEGLHISEFTNDEDGVAKLLAAYFGI